MASISTKCDANEQSDGSWTLTITTTGLTCEEAKTLGAAIADPMKVATLQAIRGRLTPSSYVTDSRSTPLCLDKGSGP